MTFKVTADGKGRVFFAATGRRLRNSLAAANKTMADIIIAGIQESALKTFKHNATDGLNASFLTTKFDKDGALIESSKIYAGVHETGRVIRARRAPYLVFRTDDGKWHRVKQVTIPSRPYISKGVESRRKKIEEFTRDHLVTIVRQSKQEAGG